MKLRESYFNGTQKYYEIHAVTVTKQYKPVYLLLDRQPRAVECQSLCGSEVTPKNSTVGSRGGHVP